MRRLISVCTAAVAALGLVALGASPASAAELPEDADLYGLTSDTYYATTAAGALTEVVGLPDDGGKYGADFDSTSGLAYFFSQGPECLLYSLVVATGVYTELGPVGTDVVDFDECDALNVAHDGTLRIADQDGTVLTVDKATGATISSVLTNIGYISAILQAPDGAFYVTEYDGDLWAYDPVTGVGTPVATVPTNYIETAVIDGAGTVWFSADGVECSQGLSSFPLSDPATVTFQGDFSDGVDCQSIYAIFVTGEVVQPAPQLAATGGVTGLAVAPFALLGLLAGAAALLIARRTRKA